MTQQVFTPKKYSPSWLPWIMNESETGSFVLAADFDFFMHLYQKQVVEIEALKSRIETLNDLQSENMQLINESRDLEYRLEYIRKISNFELDCDEMDTVKYPAD